MKDCATNKESSYRMYWVVSRWAILQNLAVDCFEWRKGKFTFDEDFMQDYDANSDKGYIPEVDVAP